MKKMNVVAGAMVLAIVAGCSAAPAEPSSSSSQDLAVGGPPLHALTCAAEPSSWWWQYTAISDPGAFWFSAGNSFTDPSTNVAWFPVAAFNPQALVVDAVWVPQNALGLFSCLNPSCNVGDVPGGDGQAPVQDPSTTNGTRYPTPHCTPTQCSSDGPPPTPPICITTAEQEAVQQMFREFSGPNPYLCTSPSRCPAEVYTPVNGGPVSSPVGLL